MAFSERSSSEADEFPLHDLRAAIDSMPQAVLVLDREYRILYQNAAAKWMSALETGSSFADVQRAIERRTPDGRLIELEDGPVMRALRGETVENEELHIRNRDTGREFTAVYSAVPIRDNEGSVVRAVVNISDVTEQRRSEAAIRAGEARLQAIIDNLAEGLVVVDAQSRALTWNPAALRLHGHETLNRICPTWIASENCTRFELWTGRPCPLKTGRSNA